MDLFVSSFVRRYHHTAEWHKKANVLWNTVRSCSYVMYIHKCKQWLLLVIIKNNVRFWWANLIKCMCGGKNFDKKNVGARTLQIITWNCPLKIFLRIVFGSLKIKCEKDILKLIFLLLRYSDKKYDNSTLLWVTMHICMGA